MVAGALALASGWPLASSIAIIICGAGAGAIFALTKAPKLSGGDVLRLLLGRSLLSVFLSGAAASGLAPFFGQTSQIYILMFVSFLIAAPREVKADMSELSLPLFKVFQRKP